MEELKMKEANRHVQQLNNDIADRAKMSTSLQNSSSYLTPIKFEEGSWWRRRTRLEKRLVVIGVLVVLTWIALAIAVILTAIKVGQGQKTIVVSNAAVKILDPNICTTPECISSAAALLESMNQSADPCEDFFEYSCGRWSAKNSIPDDRSSFGIFQQLRERVEEQLKGQLATRITAKDSVAIAKAKRLFFACVNEDKANNDGPIVFSDWMSRLNGWPMADATWSEESFDWMKTMAMIIRESPTTVFFNIFVYPDVKNTNVNRIYIDQSDLGIGRDYMLDGEQYKEYMEAYKKFIHGAARAVYGQNVSETDVNEMIAFEKTVAKLTMPPDQRRNKTRMYNKLTIAQLTAFTNETFDWLRYVNLVMADVKVFTERDEVIVPELRYVLEVAHLINVTDKRLLANYMVWRYVMSMSWHVGAKLRNLQFDFEKTVLGVLTPSPRSRFCTSLVNMLIDYAAGRLYIDAHFGVESKNEAEEMIGNLREAFGDMLDTNTWMDRETRMIAKDKAAAMVKFIGYPDWILNNTALDKYYENVSVSDVHLENIRNTLLVKVLRSLNDINVPFDRSRWITTPSVVDAFYDPVVNSITFPAGILQAPFYQARRIHALNYGAIGIVIGHEITHAFDDQGRQTDKFGNLKQWWSDRAIHDYTKESDCIRDQYGNYCPVELAPQELCINGNNTLGENIADNGGVKEAFLAYKKWVKIHGEEKRLPGLEDKTPEQLFFLSYGHIWCGLHRFQSFLNTVLYDVHSPGKFRVIGALANSRHFAEAFKCKSGTALNPVKKCKVF